MKDLVIIGAGGFGRETLTVLAELNKVTPTWNVLGLVDDNVAETVEGYKVLGNLEWFLSLDPKPYYFIAIADSHARERIANRCKAAGFTAATIICGGPLQVIADSAEIGEGVYIGRNCGIMPNAKIEPFAVVQATSVIGHDATVGAFTSMMAGAYVSGAHIGKHCYFGLRCTIVNYVTIADNCTFGACSCVVKDALVPGTYVGVPAKMIKPLEK